MGNQVLSSSSPIYVSPSLTWGKDGDGKRRDHAIPYTSSGKGTRSDVKDKDTNDDLEALFTSVAFKEYLLANIDSDYLITSVLSSAVHDDKTLLEGIPQFNSVDVEMRAEILAKIEEFEQSGRVGSSSIKLKDALNTCAQNLSLRSELQCSPFYKSFQMKLALLVGMKVHIENERKEARKQKSSQSLVMNNFNSTDYPQLKALLGLKGTALGLLKVFPLCYNALATEEQRMQLSKPIHTLCDTIMSLGDLEFFDCWSPRTTLPLIPMLWLSENIIKSTPGSGDPRLAIDGDQRTSWTCAGGGSWTCTFTEPTDITAVRIAWTQDYTPPSLAEDETAVEVDEKEGT